MFGFPRSSQQTREQAYYARLGWPTNGLVAHCHARTLTRQLRDGESVVRWPSALVANDLITITASAPVYRWNAGMPYVESSGSQQMASAAWLGIVAAGARTIVTVGSWQNDRITVAMGGWGSDRRAFGVGRNMLWTWGNDYTIGLPDMMSVVTITYDVATIRIRVNGLQTHSISQTLETTDNALRLFNWGYGDRPASVRVAGVAVWNRALSADELRNIERVCGSWV